MDLTAPGISGGYKPAGLANEASLHFNYTRSDDRFEEVNIYYHIDKFQRYIQSLGFINERNVSNRSIPAHAHFNSDFNAFYWSFDRGLHFGDGNTLSGIPFSGVDAAEDADIILHEYGHAIQDDQVPGINNFGEAGSMGEGFGDYIAASFFSTVNNGFQRACVGDWFAANYSTSNPPCIRRVDGEKHYPENITNEVHDDGEIWSASLWDIWEIFGSNVTDKIVIESNFYLSPDSNFSDGANAVILADRNLYGGGHVPSIEAVFENRGILPNNSDFLSGGWSYRKLKTINGTTAGYQINYQMKLKLYNSSGTDTPGNVYLNGNVRDDFGDLRFTKSDGITLLDYWIESYTSGVNATVWVEVDYIPANPGTADIYLYYGNPYATSASNGKNTFLAYGGLNDFTEYDPNSKIQKDNDTQLSIMDGIADTGHLYKAASGSIQDFVLDFDVKSLSPSYGSGNFPYCLGINDRAGLRGYGGYGAPDNDGHGVYMCWHIDGFWRLVYNNLGSYSGSGDMSVNRDTWYYMRVVRSGTTTTFYIYNDAARTSLKNSKSLDTGTAAFTYLHAVVPWSSREVAIEDASLKNYILRKYASPEPAWSA